MPIYEYQCKDCQHTFEQLVFQNDHSPVCCPRCNSEKVTRLMSASSIFSSTSGLGHCAAPAGGGFS
ncbi:MAG: zinc ribbon domain-containing protein [Desulfobacterales bacterium]|jgi:putative FmdB family regulatory protein|nr:zinc ribbon domain-containing protein [Desulfobacteraceae bacterium]MDY0310845.1 zinc ribbon domain-containing protein [Desulfobacterales bacterium]